MTKVNDIFNYLNKLAPITTAENYDNPGLLVGSCENIVKKAILSLDISSKTALEAANSGAQLIISHHPVIFNPIKKVLSYGETAPVYNLLNNSLSAICMHTNLDRADGGVNDALCEKIGIQNKKGLGEPIINNFKKIVVFVPKGYQEKVRVAMSEAGAGKLGEYDGCAFDSEGTGYFRPLENAKPFIGTSGKFESTKELRLEAICEPKKVKSVVKAMLNSHPYEVPAYDIFDNEAVTQDSFIGRIGEIEKELSISDFAKIVKEKLSSSCVKYVDANGKAKKIAVCSGATDEEFIKDAVSSCADTILTGELKHHMYNYCREYGINIVEAGHFATETIVLPFLKEKLEKAFPKIEFIIAESNVEPYFTV